MNEEVSLQTQEVQPINRLDYGKTLECLGLIESLGIPSRIEMLMVDFPRDLLQFRSDMGILRQYYNDPDVTLVDVANLRGLRRNTVEKARNETFNMLWSNLPPDVKAEYPLAQLRRSKPKPVALRARISELKGGKSAKIKTAFEEGKTTQQIQDELDITPKQMKEYRRFLRAWGINLPSLRDGNNVTLEIENAKGPLSDEKKQELLDRASAMYLDRWSGESGHFAKLKEVVLSAGYRPVPYASPLFAAELKEWEIPMSEKVILDREPRKGHGRQVARHIFRSDFERAVMVIKYNPKFDKYKPEAKK